MRTPLPLIGLAALALTACDVSQDAPQTIRAALPRDAGVTPAAPTRIDSLPASATGGNGGGTGTGASERSIRLYGPGVSRKRQTRV